MIFLPPDLFQDDLKIFANLPETSLQHLRHTFRDALPPVLRHEDQVNMEVVNDVTTPSELACVPFHRHVD